MEDLIEKYKGYLDENLDEQLEEELDEVTRHLLLF